MLDAAVLSRGKRVFYSFLPPLFQSFQTLIMLWLQQPGHPVPLPCCLPGPQAAPVPVPGSENILTDMSVPEQNRGSIQQLCGRVQSTVGMYCVHSASGPNDTLNAKIFFFVQNLARNSSHKTVVQLWANLLYEMGIMYSRESEALTLLTHYDSLANLYLFSDFWACLQEI